MERLWNEMVCMIYQKFLYFEYCSNKNGNFATLYEAALFGFKMWLAPKKNLTPEVDSNLFREKTKFVG